VIALVGAFFFWPLGLAAGVLLVPVVNFFRDPARRSSAPPSAFIAPADGRVVEIARTDEPEHIRGPAVKVAIFMSLFDVHVNRMPCAATVEWVRHRPGRFMNAVRSAASLENERTQVAMRDDAGRPLLLQQVAGLVARRIVCPVRNGQRFARGERFGMITFGSRVELFLPEREGPILRVRLGQRVRAGATALGEWP